jgi:hypothetical protein
MINYTPIAFQSSLYVQPVNDAFASLQKYFTDGGGGFGGAGLSVADFTTMSGPLIWALQSSNAQALYLQASGTASHTLSISATGVTSSAINLQAGGTSLTSLLRVVQTSASATFPSVLLNNTNSSALVRGILLSGSGITAESTGTTPLTVPIVDAEGYIRLPANDTSGLNPNLGAAYVPAEGLRLRSGNSWYPGNVDGITLEKAPKIQLKAGGVTPRKQAGVATFSAVPDNAYSYLSNMASFSVTGASGRYALIGLCGTDGGNGRISLAGVGAAVSLSFYAEIAVNGVVRNVVVSGSLGVAGTLEWAASRCWALMPLSAGSNSVTIKNGTIFTTVNTSGVKAYAVLL